MGKMSDECMNYVNQYLKNNGFSPIYGIRHIGLCVEVKIAPKNEEHWWVEIWEAPILVEKAVSKWQSLGGRIDE